MRTFVHGILAAVFGLICAVGAQAQEVTGKISLELNQLQPLENGGCRMSIIATNGLERPMEQLSLEMVAFDKDGLVDQFLGLKFSRISAGKTKILQFALAGRACDSISRLHVNNVSNCVPPSITDVYCPDLLELSNRTPIRFGD